VLDSVYCLISSENVTLLASKWDFICISWR